MAYQSTNNVVLALTDIDASYCTRQVLRSISMSVKKGQAVCLIGPNGAGKSTLLRVISGMKRPSSGKVFFNGEDVTCWPVHWRVKSGMAHFLQGGEVFSDLSVRENLELGAFGLTKRELEDGMENVLDLFPMLKEIASRRGAVLSGGERQMLALATILVRKPQLFLLDEPSAGLSPKGVQDLIRKIKEVNKKNAITIILAEQNVSVALAVSDRVYLLKGGEMMSHEEPQILLAGDKLDQLFF